MAAPQNTLMNILVIKGPIRVKKTTTSLQIVNEKEGPMPVSLLTVKTKNPEAVILQPIRFEFKNVQRKPSEAYMKSAAKRTIHWFLIPKMVIMFYCAMLAFFSLNLVRIEELAMTEDDAFMALYAGLFYIVLRIGLFWRFDIRLQLVQYMFSAWIWGLIVFYFVVHPPIYLTSLAVIIMTITGAGIYFQVNLLTLLDKIDPRTTESFQAAMCIPLAVLLAAQPCYYFGFGTSSCNGQYEDFMRNVLVGIAVAIGICFERIWYVYQFINSDKQMELAKKLDDICGNDLQK